MKRIDWIMDSEAKRPLNLIGTDDLLETYSTGWLFLYDMGTQEATR